MNPTPTPDTHPVDIHRLRELLAKATPGPLEIVYSGTNPVIYGLNNDDTGIAFDNGNDALFIAALRNDAPALLDELTDLRSAWEEIFEARKINGPSYIETARAILAERDKLREEAEISKECNQLLNGTLDIAKANLDFLRQQNEQLLKEIEELKAWKESQLKVESEGDLHAIARLLGGTVGESVRKIICEKVPEMIKELEKLTSRPTGLWKENR